ncbi:MAG: hypothetical protein IK117_06925 [Bacteroidales bacterium]|nr:hypothetical protein [Bacteroidales bacterium]
MKRHTILLSVLLFCVFHCLGNSADSIRRNTFGLEVGGFMLSQSYENNVKSTATKELRPNIDFWYERTLWRNLAIGIRYDFKQSDPNARWYKQRIRNINCVANDNSIFLSFAYSFCAYNFFIKPILAVGICFPHFTTPGYGDHLVVKQKEPITYHGITLGYNLRNWDVFIAYNYDSYNCLVDFDGGVSANWMFPTVFTHRVLRLGISYKI